MNTIAKYTDAMYAVLVLVSSVVTVNNCIVLICCVHAWSMLIVNIIWLACHVTYALLIGCT